MNQDRQQHWQAVYAQKSSETVSWYRAHLEQSLAMLAIAKLPKQASIVDVGGGASTLVDDLLNQGYVNLTVIDIAAQALAASQLRLGDLAQHVNWVIGDVTTPLLEPQSVDFWHDRAVFHFLGGEQDRIAYRAQVERCVRPGGYVMVATFGLDGPERCSGLPVTRYDADGIAAALGERFERIAEAKELHETPSGASQSFVYCLCRRRPQR